MLTELDHSIIDYIENYRFEESFLKGLMWEFEEDYSRQKFLHHLVKLVALDELEISTEVVEDSRHKRLDNDVEMYRPETEMERFTYKSV